MEISCVKVGLWWLVGDEGADPALTQNINSVLNYEADCSVNHIFESETLVSKKTAVNGNLRQVGKKYKRLYCVSVIDQYHYLANTWE